MLWENEVSKESFERFRPLVEATVNETLTTGVLLDLSNDGKRLKIESHPEMKYSFEFLNPKDLEVFKYVEHGFFEALQHMEAQMDESEYTCTCHNGDSTISIPMMVLLHQVILYLPPAYDAIAQGFTDWIDFRYRIAIFIWMKFENGHYDKEITRSRWRPDHHCFGPDDDNFSHSFRQLLLPCLQAFASLIAREKPTKTTTEDWGYDSVASWYSQESVTKLAHSMVYVYMSNSYSTDATNIADERKNTTVTCGAITATAPLSSLTLRLSDGQLHSDRCIPMVLGFGHDHEETTPEVSSIIPSEHCPKFKSLQDTLRDLHPQDKHRLSSEPLPEWISPRWLGLQKVSDLLYRAISAKTSGMDVQMETWPTANVNDKMMIEGGSQNYRMVVGHGRELRFDGKDGNSWYSQIPCSQRYRPPLPTGAVTRTATSHVVHGHRGYVAPEHYIAWSWVNDDIDVMSLQTIPLVDGLTGPISTHEQVADAVSRVYAKRMERRDVGSLIRSYDR